MDEPQDASALTEALARRTAQLHEVDHRVKNTLQLISSLVLLQSRREQDPHTRAALQSIQERVGAVASVHRRMFQNKDFARVDVAEVIRDLGGDLMNAVKRQGLTIELDLEPVWVPATQAAPIALVINELVGNALKHAFPGDAEGAVRISLVRQSNGFEIAVSDNGVGKPGGTAGGFGLTVVQLLCQQLRATAETQPTQPGVRVVVKVPLADPRA